MEIVSLVLEGYQRFQLRQIRSFTYRPKQKMQVILGTNGVGKSSLMWELSPLPAHHTVFPDGGKKEIEILHKGSHYLLQSIVDSAGRRYYFFKDGENLNPGFTATVYTELVKEHLNYTVELHRVLTAQTLFHRMSPAERRHWFSLLGEEDYTYATKYYQSLREQIRNLKGSIDIDQARLVQETAKRIDPEQREVLLEALRSKRAILDDLLKARRPLNTTNSVEERLKALDGVRDYVTRTCAQLNGEIYAESENDEESDLEKLNSRLTQLKRTQANFQQEVSIRFEVSEKLRKQLDAVSSTGRHSLEEVQRDIQDLDEEFRSLTESFDQRFHFDDVDAALVSYNNCKEYATSILLEFSEIPKMDYTRERHQDLSEQLASTKAGLLRAKAFEAESFQRKTHLEKHKDDQGIECPQCKHTWSPNYSEIEYKESVETHELALSLVVRAEKALEAIDTELQCYSGYSDLMRRWTALQAQTSPLSSFWSSVNHENQFLKHPGKALESLRGLGSELLARSKCASLKKRIAEHQSIEKVMLDNRKLNLDQVERDYKEVCDRIDVIQAQLRECNFSIMSVSKRIALLERIDRQAAGVIEEFKEFSNELDDCLDETVKSLMDELIHQLRGEVAEIDRQVCRVDLQNGVIDSLSRSIDLAKRDMHLLKLAEKALSPKEGLIAKGMTNFINQFVDAINGYIEEIWSYPLQLKQITYSDEGKLDLDYSFAVRINDSFDTDDISETSDGIRAIIDRAFIDVVMRYLKLDGYPIWLDEFAKAFDTKHREQAYAYIESLVDSDHYSQVFMVSHYQDGYGSFSNAEFVVLCDANISLPKHLTSNSNVEIS